MGIVPTDDSASPQRSWLVFALGPYLMCAAARDVEGIIQCPEPIAKLPLTPDYALGAFLFRGRSAAAISLRRRLRLGQGEDLRSGPFIVTRIGAALVAFWVDEVKDVLEEKGAAWRPMPSMLAGGLFERFAIRESQLILQTSFAALRDAEVEFESLAGWVAEQAATSPSAAGEAAPAARSAVAAPSGSEGLGNDLPPPAAPIISDDPARSDDSPGAAHGRPMSPTQARVTPKLALPARLSAAAAAGRARVAGERHRDPPVLSAKMQGAIVGAPASVQALEPRSVAAEPSGFQAEPAAVAVRAGRRSARLVIALGLGMSAVAAPVYLLVPAQVDERHARWVASPAAPSAQDAIAPAVPPTPPSDQVTLTIERRRPGVSSDAKVTHDSVAARLSTSQIHTVVKGDTLWQIAKQQVGDPFRYPELAKLSAIRDPDRIRPGDVIRIEIPRQR